MRACQRQSLIAALVGLAIGVLNAGCSVGSGMTAGPTPTPTPMPTPTPNPAPSIATLSPATRVVGGTDFTLTVSGSNFVAPSVVQWNGSSRPTTFVSSSQLTAQIQASD